MAGASLRLHLALRRGFEDATTPSSTPSAAPSALNLTQPAPLKPGTSVPLQLTATLTDGTTATPKNVVWRTSNPDVATVSAAGVVTALAEGIATVTASVEGVSATVTLSVRAGGLVLNGLVTESAPTEERVVANAVVAVIDRPYAGITATSDAAGRFVLDDVNGTLRIRATRSGFRDAVLDVNTLNSGTTTVRAWCRSSWLVTDAVDGPLLEPLRWTLPHNRPRAVSCSTCTKRVSSRSVPRRSSGPANPHPLLRDS